MTDAQCTPWLKPLLLIALAVIIPRGALAVNPETLLMPGKLTAHHQKYEEQCSLCHDRASRARQTQLCLDCHKDIAKDLRAGAGYHGRIAGIEKTECRACHSDHQGREADIVKFSREQFDHSRTDFELSGIHRMLPCESCHLAHKPMRDVAHDCASCHNKQDPHQGKVSSRCTDCHDSTSWSEIRFRHDQTAFALHDRHAEIACGACHFGNRYKGTPTQCADCHTPDDVHHGERGPKCADCHTTKAWKNSKFDHARETGYPLEGIHDRIGCADCHRSGNLKDKLPRQCAGCHQAQDPHAGRLGRDCGKCHGNEKWDPASFDHDHDTSWPLLGKHAKVACQVCHTAVVATQKLPTDCIGCHRHNDVHGGRLGKRCDDCHTNEGWNAGLRFDHDLTRYPLVGQHVAVPCAQCHVTRQYRDVGHQCFDCHRSDDVHKGELGKDCARCHNPNSWSQWQFDHGKETGFALSGAHGKLACEGCHRRPPDQEKLKTDCISCHARDDVHLGQYGRNCDRCHSTFSFKGARVL